MLGDAALVVPIIMLQLLIMTPVALTLLEIAATGRASVRATVVATLRNPMIVAVLLGVVVAVTGLRLPRVLADPLEMIGHAAVPVVLIAFGMTLSGRRVLAAGPGRVPTVAAPRSRPPACRRWRFCWRWRWGWAAPRRTR